jgi:cation diffusion facilitator family transporter
VLTTAKLAVAVATGSVGVLSEAIHSALDLLSSIVTFFVVRASIKPADWDHPFGHQKLESLSAMFEAFLLLAAGAYIVYEGLVTALSTGHHVHYLGWGLAVTGASSLVNLFVYFQNRGVARAEESIAIETNSFHFLTDVFSSFAVFASLALVGLTGAVIFDPLVALLVAAYVFWTGVAQIKKCVAELSDTALPDDEVAEVLRVLDARRGEFLNYHDLRTRKAGPVRYIELHLTVCSEDKVKDAHATCDRIEADLLTHFREVDVNIHVEPCGNHGPECGAVCMFHDVQRGEKGRV